MREIKFRAWDKRTNSIREVTELYWLQLSQGMESVFERVNVDDEPRHLNEVELMQYTGLKDKNGVKVFEGDIIRQAGNSWGELLRVPKIDFLNGWTALAFSEPYEVIGNIYENPELVS